MDYQKLKSITENLSKTQEQIKNDVKALNVEQATLKLTVENNENRDVEERDKNAEKFNELYASRNKTNEAITELATTIKMMASNMDMQFKNLEKKIDELKAEKR